MTSTLSFSLYAEVIVDLEIGKVLDYGIPEALQTCVRRGAEVAILVRGKRRKGYIFALKAHSTVSRVLPILEVLQMAMPVSEDLFDLSIWMARYYCTPLSKVFKTVLPSTMRGKAQEKQQWFVSRCESLEKLTQVCIALRQKAPAQAAVLDELLRVQKGMLLTVLLEKSKSSRSAVDALKEKGLIHLEQVKVDRSLLHEEDYFPSLPKPLHQEQAAALKHIEEDLLQKQFAVHLLHGVTGSGKTEVYLQAIQMALEAKRSALVLVPEVALTPQTVERFRARFGPVLAVLHHRVSAGERFDAWNRLFRGEAVIAIGARSAVFSPLPHLGLLVVDEEHESSYKQGESQPCYHARDVAVMRGKLNNSVVLLGSATPSAESYENALSGKYRLSTLLVRAQNAHAPRIRLVDLTLAQEKAQGFTLFAPEILQAIDKRCQLGEQSLLFLNRRGYHTALICTGCKGVVECPACDVALAFHKEEAILLCHTCGFRKPVPESCPHCTCNLMQFRGVGTQQVERALHAIFPNIRTLRMDADTTRHQGSHQKILRAFGSGKADVLIGTQMIAKGLHFPQVTFVGILNSDASLQIPDFRASETTFQLLTQVAGRSGRGYVAGEVVMQTRNPEHPILQWALSQDYAAFIQAELALRREFHYPPFMQMAKVVVTGGAQEEVVAFAEQMHAKMLSRAPKEWMVHEVLPAGRVKREGVFRYQFLLRAPKQQAMGPFFTEVCASIARQTSIQWYIDIQPMTTYF